MAGLGQSSFLQALGWATLNSIWQMALLWCCFLVANYVFNLSASKKYFFSLVAILAGAIWFMATFVLYYNGYFSYRIKFSTPAIAEGDFIPLILSAASISYLLLLIVPAYKLFFNWKRVQFLKKNGLQKVELRYKLFVKKIAVQLGINKNVGVYFSEMVKSPLTIGYFKPLILLPLASINNLTVQQVEAVLLHELSHIRRLDYIVNILVCVIHTILYFNPFARLLIKVVQEERENCCDQMVLQFGYDKVSYASALLSLEKSSLLTQSFVLGAAGKRNLLSRIEKIVGVEKKFSFRWNHFIGLIAALICIFVFNSFLITSKEGYVPSLSFNHLTNPFYFLGENDAFTGEKIHPDQKTQVSIETKKVQFVKVIDASLNPLSEELDPVLPPPPFLQVAYNEAQTQLSEEQADHIKATIENTKKVLKTHQWKEVENAIGDALTLQEKAAVKQEYLQEINKINWQKVENGLKTAYENINWGQIDGFFKNTMVKIKLDSLQNSCEETLKAIQKLEAKITDSSTISVIPFPDESLNDIKKHEENAQYRLKQIKTIQSKKVIKL